MASSVLTAFSERKKKEEESPPENILREKQSFGKRRSISDLAEGRGRRGENNFLSSFSLSISATEEEFSLLHRRNLFYSSPLTRKAIKTREKDENGRNPPPLLSSGSHLTWNSPISNPGRAKREEEEIGDIDISNRRKEGSSPDTLFYPGMEGEEDGGYSSFPSPFLLPSAPILSPPPPFNCCCVSSPSPYSLFRRGLSPSSVFPLPYKGRIRKLDEGSPPPSLYVQCNLAGAILTGAML